MLDIFIFWAIISVIKIKSLPVFFFAFLFNKVYFIIGIFINYLVKIKLLESLSALTIFLFV